MSGAHRPLIFGEVLFDVFPDGSRVLGGAPFNVAWHLEAFGLRPLMVTRVGTDDPGDEVLAAMQSWGMDVSGVQRDHFRPTGRVEVDLEGGEPTFEILPDQSYDRIDGDLALQSVGREDFSILYHGSLISRTERSRSALDCLKRGVRAPVFIDVNLRQPWWDRENVEASVGGAKWAKLNEEELGALTGSTQAPAAEDFRAKRGLDVVIVTRGDHGAIVVDRDGTHEAMPSTGIRVADTVGAGDAFSAVFILGLVRGWSTGLTLQRSIEFAAGVCTVAGATVRDRGFYSDFIGQGW